MLLFVLFATATCMSTAPKNTIEENTMSQNELKNKTGPTFIDTVSATKLQMERWMGKQDEEERVKSGRLTLTLLICKTILMMLVRRIWYWIE